MNLIEAIEAGAQRVDGRGRGEYLDVSGSGRVYACAIGAAYLGCHPDVDPSELFHLGRGWSTIHSWVRSREVPTGAHDGDFWWMSVTGINDGMSASGDDWDALVGEVVRQAPELAVVEVCETGGES
jgi:hypothetical protein